MHYSCCKLDSSYSVCNICVDNKWKTFGNLKFYFVNYLLYISSLMENMIIALDRARGLLHGTRASALDKLPRWIGAACLWQFHRSKDEKNTISKFLAT